MHHDLFRRYTEARAATESVGRTMPYDWTGMPKRLAGAWMVYSSMLDGFAREIANATNAFAMNVRRLHAWAAVLDTLGQGERAEAIHEFGDPIATLCLLTPYAIRSQLIFATAHLCHQANRIRENKWAEDSLPVDEKIHMHSANRRGAPWGLFYERLKKGIKAVGGEAFRRDTGDFRNAFTHRSPPRVEAGYTNFAKRRIDRETRRMRYDFGDTEPLAIRKLTALLDAELHHCYEAFEAFQALVAEQVAFVTSKNAEMLADGDARSATRAAVDGQQS